MPVEFFNSFQTKNEMTTMGSVVAISNNYVSF